MTRREFRHWVTLLALMAMSGTAVPGVSAHEADQETGREPVPYTARYQASANGLKASATRSLTLRDDGSYVLANELQATVLGQEIARLEQRSEFHYREHSLFTDLYSYRLSGISSDRRSIVFDWDNGSALSMEDDESWTLPLSAGVFDPLSHQLALRMQLLDGVQADYAFNVIDGDEIEAHRYAFLGEELLQTPLGPLNSLKFERVRERPGARSTVIWVAADWQFLIARIEQVNGSLSMTLQLESAEVDGQTVTALPVL